jgi:co-chaperonin GroES (HSP10)
MTPPIVVDLDRIDLPTPSEEPRADGWTSCDHLIRDGQTTIGRCDLPWGHDGEHQHLVAEPAHPSRVRPLDDNVLLYLKPRPERMAGSRLILPATRAGKATGAREAIVLATGPGWRLRGGRGPLVPTGVEPGQCVVVDARAGQDWALDVGKPRTNPIGCQWTSFPVPCDLERPGGEYRIVRADEILFELVDQTPEAEALELDLSGRGA